uniref:hypothetical protein n=1 Tax=Endozoicomonas sp. ONNA2 TaxID=2828741 RepID=UPI002147338B
IKLVKFFRCNQNLTDSGKSNDMAALEMIENTLNQRQEDQKHSDFTNVLEYIQLEKNIRSDRWYQ